MKNDQVLRIVDLRVGLQLAQGRLPILRGVDLTLGRGEWTTILGESGCGKSILAMTLFALLPPAAEARGEIFFDRRYDLLRLPPAVMRQLRGDLMVLAPQNPRGSLDPLFTVGAHIRESLRRTRRGIRRDRERLQGDVLRSAGFAEPEKIARLYPHQLSGGMAQRVVIALSLCGNPLLAVADEPTKGLDRQARDQYLLLARHHFANAGLLVISHDLAVAAAGDRVMVMYCGEIVEEGPAGELLAQPRHPYTKGLIAAHPAQAMRPIAGALPGVAEAFEGCSFYPRCQRRALLCRHQRPALRPVDKRRVRCHHA